MRLQAISVRDSCCSRLCCLGCRRFVQNVRRQVGKLEGMFDFALFSGGPIIANINSVFLRPPDFSALK